MESLKGQCWVIGNVHGCLCPLQKLLGVLPRDDHLVFCGDVINKGPDSASAMRLVWGLVKSGAATWLCGNHEQAFINTLSKPDHNGHNQLLNSDCCRQLGKRSSLQWMRRLKHLPKIFWGRGWVATHAGFDRNGCPDLTIREPFWENYDGSHGLVVIGHTPRPDVERHGQIVMVDTGAVYGGKLSAYCPETEAIVQVEGLQDGTTVPPTLTAPLTQAEPC